MDKAATYNTKIVLSSQNDAYAVANLLYELDYLPAVYFAKDGTYIVEFNKTKNKGQ